MSNVASLKDTIVPKSDQLNAEQLLSGPMTITVTEVERVLSEDQPVILHYQGENGRPYKPCKTMRKVLIFAWGDDGREWVGKAMTLYCDHDVKFGVAKVGGIRISHLSHIQRDIAMSLTTTRGKKSEFIIHKLDTGRAIETLQELLTEAANKGTKALRAAWSKSMTDMERAQFNGTCPPALKEIASVADAQQMAEQA